jgi:hypothetical protein
MEFERNLGVFEGEMDIWSWIDSDEFHHLGRSVAE